MSLKRVGFSVSDVKIAPANEWDRFPWAEDDYERKGNELVMK
jgi:hypothetical protein